MEEKSKAATWSGEEKEKAQEKEEEVEKVAQRSSARMKRFQVLCQVEVPETDEDGSTLTWCCVLDHALMLWFPCVAIPPLVDFRVSRQPT